MKQTEKNIQREVKRLRSACKLPRKCTSKNLKDCIKAQGYKIYTYSERPDLLEKLHLIEKSRIFSAITVSEGNVRIVFLADCRSEAEQVLILAHELGHILLKHYNERKFLLADIQEYEANTFAALLLSPPTNNIFAHLLFSASILLFSISLIAFHPMHIIPAAVPAETEAEIKPIEIQKTVSEETVAPPITTAKTQTIPPVSTLQPVQLQQSNPLPPQTPPTKTTPEPENTFSESPELLSTTFAVAEEVIVTKTGTKYHKPTCGHIKNRQNLRTLSQTEAEQQGYTACADCF